MTSDRPTRKPAPRPFGPRTYEQPDLDSVPLSPKRWRYVLNLILARHAWRHSTRNKGVGYDTIAEHGRLIVWMFRFLREHPKRYRLDPRSFTGRHVDCVMGHWAQEVKAGRLPAGARSESIHCPRCAPWPPRPSPPLGQIPPDPHGP